ncbi:unnamed protein product [Spirodela intermedia]|uniref:Uncharacterized protein n=1 Tax=Spirodela intermedia TaxID=51605 RepID=A0A7I8LKP4_SPIIN|nr:unnamed protein product [Spirodela intermedia]
MEAFTPPLLGFRRLVPCTYATAARSWLTAAFLVFLLETYIGWAAMRKGNGCMRKGIGKPCSDTSNPANPYRRGCSH